MQIWMFTSICLSTTLVFVLVPDVSESRTVPVSEKTVPTVDEVQNFIALRDELGASLRDRLAARFDINDPSFNQILEDVLKSIHRYSRPRYGRSVELDVRTEKTVNEIEVEKSIKFVSTSQPT